MNGNGAGIVTNGPPVPCSWLTVFHFYRMTMTGLGTEDEVRRDRALHIGVFGPFAPCRGNASALPPPRTCIKHVARKSMRLSLQRRSYVWYNPNQQSSMGGFF